MTGNQNYNQVNLSADNKKIMKMDEGQITIPDGTNTSSSIEQNRGNLTPHPDGDINGAEGSEYGHPLNYQEFNESESVQKYGAHDSPTGGPEMNVSFRGKPIPQVPNVYDDFKRTPLQDLVSRFRQQVEIARSLTPEDTKSFDLERYKISKVHYSGGAISDVMLNTGDIISVEDAIALTNAYMIDGTTSGTTRFGGQTLRSYPDDRGENNLYGKPTF